MWSVWCHWAAGQTGTGTARPRPGTARAENPLTAAAAAGGHSFYLDNLH